MADTLHDPHCIFCRIIRREAPAQIRYETDTVIAFDDHRPKMPTHVLICPKEHYPTYLETPAVVLTQLHRAVAGVAAALGFDQRGFRLVINNGPESGQIVFHLHIHFLAGRAQGGF